MPSGVISRSREYEVKNSMEADFAPSGVESRVDKIDTLKCRPTVTEPGSPGAVLVDQAHEGRHPPSVDLVYLGGDQGQESCGLVRRLRVVWGDGRLVGAML
jgi:hypothetical protein